MCCFIRHVFASALTKSHHSVTDFNFIKSSIKRTLLLFNLQMEHKHEKREFRRFIMTRWACKTVPVILEQHLGTSHQIHQRRPCSNGQETLLIWLWDSPSTNIKMKNYILSTQNIVGFNKNARYCSRKCQVQNWSQHKAVCTPYF